MSCPKISTTTPDVNDRPVEPRLRDREGWKRRLLRQWLGARSSPTASTREKQKPASKEVMADLDSFDLPLAMNARARTPKLVQQLSPLTAGGDSYVFPPGSWGTMLARGFNLRAAQPTHSSYPLVSRARRLVGKGGLSPYSSHSVSLSRMRLSCRLRLFPGRT